MSQTIYFSDGFYVLMYKGLLFFFSFILKIWAPLIKHVYIDSNYRRKYSNIKQYSNI